MSILVRPVREQLEHDRVIRLLQAKWKKKFDVEMNVGDERTASLKVGQLTVFPDLTLYSPTSPRRLQGVVEVETGESVNHLEAMAQWTHMSKARAPFQLYVPTNSIDQARRLCAAQQVALAELWSYFVLGEQVRLTLVDRDEVLAEIPLPPKGATPLEPARSQAAAKAAQLAAQLADAKANAKPEVSTKPAAGARPAPVKAAASRAAAKAVPAGDRAAPGKGKAVVPPSKKVVTAAKAATPARPLTPGKPTGPARPAPATKAAKATKATKATKSVKTVKAAKAAKPAKAVKPAKAAKPAKAVLSAKAGKSAKSAKAAKPARPAPVRGKNTGKR